MKITITGNIGAGKSTVAKLLAKRLGYRYIYTGKYMRELAEKRGVSLKEWMSIAEKDPEVDKKVDEWQIKMGKDNDNIVVDGRMAWYFIPDSKKVFLECSEEVAAKRILEDKSKTRNVEGKAKGIKEVMEKNRQRKKSEEERYMKYYGRSHLERDNYDIVIDTSDKNAEQVVKEIIENLD